MNQLTIALKSIRQRALASSLTSLSVALGVMLMVAVLVMFGIINRTFSQNAIGYDLIVGPKGSDLQLVLSTVYRVTPAIETLPWQFYDDVKARSDVKHAIPVAVGDLSEEGNFPIVGTTGDYFKLDYAPGKPFYFTKDSRGMTDPFHAIIGAHVAQENNWKVGSTFKMIHAGVQDHVHDERFEVVGVLQRTGTPNDKTVFVNIDGFFLLDEHDKPANEARKRWEDFFGKDRLPEFDAHMGAHLLTVANEDPDYAREQWGTFFEADRLPVFDAYYKAYLKELSEVGPNVSRERWVKMFGEDTLPQFEALKKISLLELSQLSPGAAIAKWEDSYGPDSTLVFSATLKRYFARKAKNDPKEAKANWVKFFGSDSLVEFNAFVKAAQQKPMAHHHHDHGEGEDHDHHHHHHGTPDILKEISAIFVLMERPPGEDETAPSTAAPLFETELKKGFQAQAVNPIFPMMRLKSIVLGNVRIALLIMTTLIIIVSGVSIFVSIYNSMADRKRAIAIMRALGARRQTVLTIILLESIVLCVGGGILGMLMGHGLVYAAAPYVEARSGLLINPLSFEMTELYVIPAMVVLASLVGFIPAMTAYRTDVAQTLAE